MLPRRHHAPDRDQARAQERHEGGAAAHQAEELSSFNECFITGTAAEVTPVGEIAGIKFKPGNMTKTLIDAYTAAVTPK